MGPRSGDRGNTFQAAGITFDVASLTDFSTRFPFTTKTELVADQSAQPSYGTNLTYPLNQYTRFHQTSGTSGAPLRWLDTPESWDCMVQSWMEIFRAAEVGVDDRVMFALEEDALLSADGWQWIDGRQTQFYLIK